MTFNDRIKVELGFSKALMCESLMISLLPVVSSSEEQRVLQNECNSEDFKINSMSCH